MMPNVLKWVKSCETEIYEQMYCHLDKMLVCIFCLFYYFYFKAHFYYFMLTDKL